MPGKIELRFKSDKLGDYPLDKEVITIGRREDNDIQINNLAVSGHHAKILSLFDDAFLEDLSSTNGTFVNGQRVDKHPLKNGDIISIGKHELRYINYGRRSDDDFEKTVIISRPAASKMAATGAAPAAPVAKAPDLSRARLQILNGKNAGKQMPLDKPSVKLGATGLQVVINRRPDGHFIVVADRQDTTKVVKVNGVDLGAGTVRLQNHDIIEINQLKIEYFIVD
ncbi:MAG: hypothetical protein RLZZ385_2121 [Pseudomonadota bacterium]